MIVRSLLAALLLAGFAVPAQAQLELGNPAISPSVRTYGLPQVEMPPINNRLRSDNTQLRTGRPEIHDRMQNPNRDFMQRRRVDRDTIFFSGSDKDGNPVMGTCIRGQCR